MLKPEFPNPKEVLAHLNSLGYHDITPEQLKEFIHDLIKLIKYEQKHALQDNLTTKQARIHPSECCCSCPECDTNSDKLSSDESYCESSTSSCSTSATYSQSNKYSKLNKNSSRNPSEFDQLAHTSFIRPWNLQMCKDFSSRGKKKLDPVRLYHHYKELWKNQNIPGESKHSELRWVIRNRMLGQEPNPRVCTIHHKHCS